MPKAETVAKELLLVVLKALPGGDLAASIFDDDIDAMLKRLVPSDARKSELRDFAQEIADRVRARALSIQRDPGAALSAANDFVASIKAADLTFTRLEEAEFDPVRLKSYLDTLRPGDWKFASNQRRQLWDEAVQEFCEQLLLQYFGDQRFQTQLLVLLYRQQKRLLTSCSTKPPDPHPPASSADNEVPG